MHIPSIFDASFRGVPFEATELPGEFERKLLVAKLPFSDRRFIYYMGLGAKRMPVSVLLSGAENEQQLNTF